MKRLLLTITIFIAATVAGMAQSGSLATAFLSPNPVEDRVDLNFEQPIKEDLQIVIKDLTGKTVYSMRPETGGEDCYRIAMDLDFLRKGIYIMQVLSPSGKTKTLKLQKV
jgi:hypothetical protein